MTPACPTMERDASLWPLITAFKGFWLMSVHLLGVVFSCSVSKSLIVMLWAECCNWKRKSQLLALSHPEKGNGICRKPPSPHLKLQRSIQRERGALHTWTCAPGGWGYCRRERRGATGRSRPRSQASPWDRAPVHGFSQGRIQEQTVAKWKKVYSGRPTLQCGPSRKVRGSGVPSHQFSLLSLFSL